MTLKCFSKSTYIAINDLTPLAKRICSSTAVDGCIKILCIFVFHFIVVSSITGEASRVLDRGLGATDYINDRCAMHVT